MFCSSQLLGALQEASFGQAVPVLPVDWILGAWGALPTVSDWKSSVGKNLPGIAGTEETGWAEG